MKGKYNCALEFEITIHVKIKNQCTLLFKILILNCYMKLKLRSLKLDLVLTCRSKIINLTCINFKYNNLTRL